MIARSRPVAHYSDDRLRRAVSPQQRKARHARARRHAPPHHAVQVELVRPYLDMGLVDRAGEDLWREAHGENATEAKFHKMAVSGVFELKYVNKEFTEYEYTLKYTFFFCSAVLAIWYLRGVSEVRSSQAPQAASEAPGEGHGAAAA